MTEPNAGAGPAGVAPDPADAAPGPAASEGAQPDADATCPWCGAPASAGATRCPACGAALAQRESIGDLRIPGLTSVDPALEDFDKRPLHLRGPSPSQGAAPALIAGAAAGGPLGAVLIGGVAAVAAAELLGARRDGAEGPALADVGKPSEVLLRALEREAELPGGERTPAGTAASADTPDPAASDDGRSIWRDLQADDSGADSAAEQA